MNSSLTNSVKPLSSVQSCPFYLFPKTLYIKLDVCVSFYSSVDTLYSHHAWQCVWLVNLYSSLLEASVQLSKSSTLAHAKMTRFVANGKMTRFASM